MINSQEIIERSIYCAILEMAVKLGYTLDPSEYLPINNENQEKFEKDLKAIDIEKGFHIEVFGVGNNHSRGQKMTPRITVESDGFYPGDVGIPRYLRERDGSSYQVFESPSEALSQYMNIRLACGKAEHMRLLHQIMFWSIPQRGYLKPYTEIEPLFTGNIFLRVVNFYNNPDLDNGLMEKIYQFEVQDCLIEKNTTPTEITPIKDITVLLDNQSDGTDTLLIRGKTDILINPTFLYFGWRDHEQQTLIVNAKYPWRITYKPEDIFISQTSGDPGETRLSVWYEDENRGIDKFNEILFECKEEKLTVRVEHEGIMEIFYEYNGEFLVEDLEKMLVIKPKYHGIS